MLNKPGAAGARRVRSRYGHLRLVLGGVEYSAGASCECGVSVDTIPNRLARRTAGESVSHTAEADTADRTLRQRAEARGEFR